MYHPNLAYIVDPNNELIAAAEYEFLVVIFICTVNLAIIFAFTFMISTTIQLLGEVVLYTLWDSLWNSLTPGQEWLEILTIVTTIISGTMIIWTSNEVFNKLESSINKIKNDNAKQKQRIKELEELLLLKTEEDKTNL
jgi:hypothetical protein